MTKTGKYIFFSYMIGAILHALIISQTITRQDHEPLIATGLGILLTSIIWPISIIIYVIGGLCYLLGLLTTINGAT